MPGIWAGMRKNRTAIFHYLSDVYTPHMGVTGGTIL